MSYTRRNSTDYSDARSVPSLASTVSSLSTDDRSTESDRPRNRRELLTCPANIRQSIFELMPSDVQRELMEEYSSAQNQNNASREEVKDDDYYRRQAVTHGIDPSFLLALPTDMRDDVIKEQQTQNSSSHSTPAPRPRSPAHLDDDVTAQHMNAAAAVGYAPDVLAALPPDMRAEVLQHQASQRIHSTPNSRRSSETRNSTDLRASQQIRSPPASFHANSTAEEYEGEYDDIGLRSGHGTLKFSNGDTYTGGFLEGYRHGRGEIKFADGSKYNGAWEHDKYHGYGQRCFANGDMYIGHFDKGQRCGHGKFEYAKGDTYVGAWSNGKINGYGTYYHKNGDAYEGMFVNGVKNGPGKYSLVDGRLDISKYVNGQRRGVGLRLCAERKRAWTLVDGVLAEEISLSDAYKIQTEVGFGDD